MVEDKAPAPLEPPDPDPRDLDDGDLIMLREEDRDRWYLLIKALALVFAVAVISFWIFGPRPHSRLPGNAEGVSQETGVE